MWKDVIDQSVKIVFLTRLEEASTHRFADALDAASEKYKTIHSRQKSTDCSAGSFTIDMPKTCTTYHSHSRTDWQYQFNPVSVLVETSIHFVHSGSRK